MIHKLFIFRIQFKMYTYKSSDRSNSGRPK